MMSNYLIYCATFPNGKMYIGITKKKFSVRQSQHINLSKKDSPKLPFHRALKAHPEVLWTILHTNMTRENAIEKEILYIKELGSLVSQNGYNCTSGGEGTVGLKKTKEQIESWKLAVSGTFKSESYRKKLSDSVKIAKKQASCIENSSLAQKLRFSNPEERANTGEAVSKAMATAEVKSNLSKGQKLRFSDPAERKRHSDIKKASENYELRLQYLKVKPIVAYKNGKYVGEFCSSAICAKKLEIPNSSGIRACLTGRLKTYKGFTFAYKETL